VLFGTGQYVSSTDNANLGDQAFYAVWDTGADELVVDADPTQSDLVLQTITESGSYRTVSSNAVAYTKSGASANFGWYINLTTNSDGERAVTDPVIRGDIVYFNTSIPTSVTCSYGGTGWQMSVQSISGANPDASIFDADGNGTISNDAALSGVVFQQGLPAAPSFLSNRRYTPGTQTQSGSDVADDEVEDLGGMGTGRLSWEELFR
jgi:type IV pilus assembly protein PilY1